MMLHTTLRIAKANGACKTSYKAVKQALGRKWGLDDPIPLTRVLELQGLDDALWCLSAVLPEEETARDKLDRLLACDYAEHVAHLCQAPPGATWKPADTIEVARRYANGEATLQELDSARNRAAKWAVRAVRADEAARAVRAVRADEAAKWAVRAVGVVRAAEWAVRAVRAARAAERAESEWQMERLVAYLEGVREGA